MIIFLEGAETSAQIGSPLKYELKKQYLFLLPGSGVEKLLALHTKPVISNVIIDTMLLLPVMFVIISIVIIIIMFLLSDFLFNKIELK